jgi:hypothetical protein
MGEEIEKWKCDDHSDYLRGMRRHYIGLFLSPTVTMVKSDRVNQNTGDPLSTTSHCQMLTLSRIRMPCSRITGFDIVYECEQQLVKCSY